MTDGDDAGVSQYRDHDKEIGTGKKVHSRDWVCLECGTVYQADEDATQWTLPEYCPDCGDTWGWENRKTGRAVP